MVVSNIEKLAAINVNNIRKDLPVFEVGDTLKMKIKVK